MDILKQLEDGNRTEVHSLLQKKEKLKFKNAPLNTGDEVMELDGEKMMVMELDGEEVMKMDQLPLC